MKRSEQIAPLSRDHHDGLLFCWKIRRGLKLAADTRRMQGYIAYFWDQHLRQHFYEEENILFLPEDAHCQRAIQEHRQIEALIRQTQTGLPDTGLLQSLADRVDDHIRYEERELFPYLEKTLSPKQLNEIGTRLEALHAGEIKDCYTDEFWVQGK